MPDAPVSVTPTGPVGTTPTSSATTSVVIPSTPTQQSVLGFAEWDNVVILFMGIIAIIVVVGQIAGTVEKVSAWFERRKKKDQELDAPLDARLHNVEDAVKSFRTRDDLQRDFDLVKSDIKHIKGNLAMNNDAVAERFRKIEGQIVEDSLIRARLETKVDGMSKDFSRVEGAVERLAERMEDRLDRIQEAVSIGRVTPTKRTPSSS